MTIRGLKRVRLFGVMPKFGASITTASSLALSGLREIKEGK